MRDQLGKAGVHQVLRRPAEAGRLYSRSPRKGAQL